MKSKDLTLNLDIDKINDKSNYNLQYLKDGRFDNSKMMEAFKRYVGTEDTIANMAFDCMKNPKYIKTYTKKLAENFVQFVTMYMCDVAPFCWWDTLNIMMQDQYCNKYNIDLKIIKPFEIVYIWKKEVEECI